ncbi:unnamed protein product [Callosobruchus maculatus]|uniref:RRM domain-containing protein n=1 Tax=Callosobruchus maculatus TaxID=64391 RepID=A0A653C3W9_CALMS|nr:unnamed protein product [Callosobruchus maculatus]
MADCIDLTNDDSQEGDEVISEEKKDTQKINNPDLWCEYCNIELPDREGMYKHVTERKHANLYQAACSGMKEKQNRGIYVRGYTDKDGILDYFSMTGRIVWARIGYDFILFDYSDPSSAAHVVSKRHTFRGRHLMVKYREPPQQKPPPDMNEEPPDDQLELLRLLRLQPSVIQQALQLRTYQLHTYQQQLRNFFGIASELQMVLSRAFPQCQVHPFGSMVTGLCFRNSDVDLYISGVRRRDENDVPLLYRLKRMLTDSNVFRYVIVIANAKIPIMKCIHTATDMRCDINLRNMLGVCNSQLIKYYMSLNPKLTDLMFIIKYWAKIHKLTGQNHLFTNYSIAMMVIFFLQQPPYNFYPVHNIQTNRRFYNIQDGWNGGFEPLPLARWMHYVQGVTLTELLIDFFKFYSNFDFETMVISPFLGVALKKQTFENVESLTDLLKPYKLYMRTEGAIPFKHQAVVCIQDPFELSRNITPVISETTLKFFVSFCHLGADVFNAGPKEALYRLFTIKPAAYSEALLSQNGQTRQVVIEMAADCKYLQTKIDKNVPDKQMALKVAWFDTLKGFLKTVIKDVLRLSLEELAVESNTKNRKTEGQKDVHHKVLDATCYRCAGKLNVWGVRPQRPKTEKVLEGEKKITEALCKKVESVSSEPIIEVQFAVELKDNPTRAFIEMNKISAYRKTYRGFSAFVVEKLPRWFKTYETELNEQNVQ